MMLLKQFTAVVLFAVAETLASSQFSDPQDPSTVIIKQPDEGAASIVKASYGDDIDYCFAQLSGAWGCYGISDSPLGRYQDGACVPLKEGNTYEISTICNSAKISLFYHDIPGEDVQSVEPVDVDFNWVLDSPKAGFLYFADANKRGEIWSPFQLQDAQMPTSYKLAPATPVYLYFPQPSSHSQETWSHHNDLV
ncbi:hypothetical protein N7474_003006 [Penicillium riverlandense]|uniref:uncharacterized protein n=1 Tax=Penicillium riverlandense TaxID=1903569 RepID=UPI0025486A48|nr:uncharacterized protein N7474_003006 [Penicillium riverlandense]KAJ5825868.1 hypothetical protein N7474_003006 [Penicillium riverlandense]